MTIAIILAAVYLLGFVWFLGVEVGERRHARGMPWRSTVIVLAAWPLWVDKLIGAVARCARAEGGRGA